MNFNLLHVSRPRFSFRETRKREPVAGHVSSLADKSFLLQLLDSDPSDSTFSSWFLNRYQKILPKRVTRLSVKEQRELAAHTKRMRHLLILNNQNQAVLATRLRRRKDELPSSRKRKPTVPSQFIF